MFYSFADSERANPASFEVINVGQDWTAPTLIMSLPIKWLFSTFATLPHKCNLIK